MFVSWQTSTHGIGVNDFALQKAGKKTPARRACACPVPCETTHSSEGQRQHCHDS
jgi:hypothetical protein